MMKLRIVITFFVFDLSYVKPSDIQSNEYIRSTYYQLILDDPDLLH